MYYCCVIVNCIVLHCRENAEMQGQRGNKKKGRFGRYNSDRTEWGKSSPFPWLPWLPECGKKCGGKMVMVAGMSSPSCSSHCSVLLTVCISVWCLCLWLDSVAYFSWMKASELWCALVCVCLCVFELRPPVAVVVLILSYERRCEPGAGGSSGALGSLKRLKHPERGNLRPQQYTVSQSVKKQPCGCCFK